MIDAVRLDEVENGGRRIDRLEHVYRQPRLPSSLSGSAQCLSATKRSRCLLCPCASSVVSRVTPSTLAKHVDAGEPRIGGSVARMLCRGLERSALVERVCRPPLRYRSATATIGAARRAARRARSACCGRLRSVLNRRRQHCPSSGSRSKALGARGELHLAGMRSSSNATCEAVG